MQKTTANHKINFEVLFYLLHIVPPLLIGAFVYIWISEDSYIGNWVNMLIPITKIRGNNGILTVLRNWGCDFLWAYSMFFAIAFSTKEDPASSRKSFRLALTVAMTTELLQLIRIPGLKCGTFDVLDMLTELSAVCIGGTILYLYKSKRRKNYEKKW